MQQVIITHVDEKDGTTAFGGRLILGREFYSEDPASYLWLEAHECRGYSNAPDGFFLIAQWTPDGNNGDGIARDLNDTIQWMLKYPVPDGYYEGSIPSDIWEG